MPVDGHRGKSGCLEPQHCSVAVRLDRKAQLRIARWLVREARQRAEMREAQLFVRLERQDQACVLEWKVVRASNDHRGPWHPGRFHLYGIIIAT